MIRAVSTERLRSLEMTASKGSAFNSSRTMTAWRTPFSVSCPCVCPCMIWFTLSTVSPCLTKYKVVIIIKFAAKILKKCTKETKNTKKMIIFAPSTKENNDMKILQSSVFRAISALAIGILLIKFPDNTVTWITIAIGCLFLLSGIISLVVYYQATRKVSEYRITDAEGNVVASDKKPTFPIVAVGSVILGLLLALTPTIFITGLMYIIGAILVLGAINQYMNLLNARQFGHVGFGYWIFPSIILLTGLYVIIKPMAPASMAMLVLGWCTLLYGITELINSMKIHSERRKAAKVEEIPMAEEVKDDTDAAIEAKDYLPENTLQ